MKSYKGLKILTAIGMAAILFFAGLALAQSEREVQKQKEYEQLIYSVRGPDLYRAHCAACHGVDAKGDGPLAPSLKTKPADLTALARNNKGEFPAKRVRRFISGENVSPSHGSREMPVWGPIFHQIEEDQDYGNVRLQNLIKYLQSIQQK